MFQAAFNNIVVTIKAKYIEHFDNIIKMANLHPGSQVNPADYVNVRGTVVSIPKAITNERRGYQGFSTKDIRVGDLLVFSYSVVYEFDEMIADVPRYRNMVYYKQKEYWLVDILKAFAVARDGQIIMLNGYCMLEGMSEDGKILVPQYMQRITKSGQAILTHIGNPLEHKKRIDVNEGDTVFYNPNMVQKYSLPDGTKYGILTQAMILGKEETVYESQDLN